MFLRARAGPLGSRGDTKLTLAPGVAAKALVQSLVQTTDLVLSGDIELRVGALTCLPRSVPLTAPSAMRAAGLVDSFVALPWHASLIP